MKKDKKQNHLPACNVCKKDALVKVNKNEVECDHCHSRYTIEWMNITKKAGKNAK